MQTQFVSREELQFGRYMGYKIARCPFQYIMFLAGRQVKDGAQVVKDVIVDSWREHGLNNKEDFVTHKIEIPDRRSYKSFGIYCWIYRFQNHIIEEARKHIDTNDLCWKCGRKKVVIGRNRRNGRNHNDWETREFHKKCWKDLKFGNRCDQQEDSESNSDSNQESDEDDSFINDESQDQQSSNGDENDSGSNDFDDNRQSLKRLKRNSD